MKQLTVGLGDHGYDIWIGSHMLDRAGEVARRFTGRGERAAIVTDETVWRLYGGRVSAVLMEAGVDAVPVVVRPGEASKSLEELDSVYAAFAKAKLGRDGLVIALGGGVVGDLAGFAAATYMRGVSYLQIPTTLLAQVDSSVGGKTAIDLPAGKNLAGAFYQPREVLIDTGVQDTLPFREVGCGMAEVIKYGFIRSPELLAELEKPVSPESREGIVYACCAIKAGIVERDEFDRSERMHLNFGHTFGHGVEALYGFGRYNHGEGVAVGMVMAAEVGEALGLTEPGTADWVRRLLRIHGLPDCCTAGADALLPYMATDKKNKGGGVRLILVKKPGEAFVHGIGMEELAALMRKVEERWKQ